MLKTRVFKWASRFKESCESVADNSQDSALTITCTNDNVNHVRQLITSDQYLHIRVLSEELRINKETI